MIFSTGQQHTTLPVALTPFTLDETASGSNLAEEKHAKKNKQHSRYSKPDVRFRLGSKLNNRHKDTFHVINTPYAIICPFFHNYRKKFIYSYHLSTPIRVKCRWSEKKQ